MDCIRDNEMEKVTVVIIKSGPWRLAHLSRNHPEYSATFDLIENFESEVQFVLMGDDRHPTSGFLLNGAIAWDIQMDRFWNLTYFFDLIRLIVKYKPHLVIVLGNFKTLPVAIYSLFSKRCVYAPMFIGEFGYYGKKRIGKPLMKLFFKVLGVCLQLSRRKIISAFAISKFERQAIEKLAPKLKGKIELYSYPISPNFHSFSAREHKRTDVPIILTVAAIQPRKGLDVLVKAVALIAGKFKVIIKGSIRDASYMQELTSMVKEFNLQDKITFVTKHLDYDALASYYKSATLFVFPSREDSLGVAVLEALHCGVPVISTPVGGIPDMIENRVNGILVNPSEPHELANAILLLLNNSDARMNLAKNTRRVLSGRYYEGRVSIGEALSQSIAKAISE
jgi:glycosyltransferase involved in cell wall biosynthesis